MKTRILMTLAAVQTALFFLPGCQREKYISNEVYEDIKTESLALWFEQANGPETRVDVDGTTGVCTWTTGDKIAIWIEDGNHPEASLYQIRKVENIGDPDESTGHVMVSLAEGQNRKYFAVYPYSAAVESNHGAGNSLYVKYPDTYDFRDMTMAQVAGYSFAPMVAVNNGVDQTDPDNPVIPALYFYHVGGVLRLTIPNLPITARKLVITFPEDTKLSGTFSVTNGGTNSATLSPAGLNDHSSVVTIMLPILEGSNTVEFTFNLPMPFGDYSLSGDRKYKVTVYDEKLAYMRTEEFVNWKQFQRAEGKRVTVPDLETLGTMGGLYVARGQLYRSQTASVNPLDMSMEDYPEFYRLYNTGYMNRFLFSWVELSKIMRNDPDYVGTDNFDDKQITIDGIGYRVPTPADLDLLLSLPRPGSIVNGRAGVRYARVHVNTTQGSEFTFSKVQGLLLFPDGGKFECSNLTSWNSLHYTSNNDITYSDVRRLCGDFGCVLLPSAFCTDNRNREYVTGYDYQQAHLYSGRWWLSTRANDNPFFFVRDYYNIMAVHDSPDNTKKQVFLIRVENN